MDALALARKLLLADSSHRKNFKAAAHPPSFWYCGSLMLADALG
jgi:hypothetical protein